MRCKKCGLITFDFYEACPQCRSSFLQIKKELNIIDYSISEENNYLIPVKIEEKKEIKEEEKVVEHTSFEKEEPEELDLREFIEPTKLEEE